MAPFDAILIESDHVDGARDSQGAWSVFGKGKPLYWSHDRLGDVRL